MPTGEQGFEWKCPLLFAAVILIAYAPAFNNGFISDDYVILQRAQDFKHDPGLLISIPPEPFRLTSYLCFLVLKDCFGYLPQFFYAFTILLHFVNTLMFWRFLRSLGDDCSMPVMGALLFAAAQNPQEGVMWLAGMNEALLGTFLLAAILLWEDGRLLLSCLVMIGAFLSKESAIILVPLVPLVEFARTGVLRIRKQHAFLFLPAAVFMAFYIRFLPGNALLTSHLYAFGPRAIWVLVNSVHRLCFPWAYILAIVLTISRGWRIQSVCAIPLAWMAVSLAPYIFLTYQSHVPSRNQYVAAMGLAWLLALQIRQLPRHSWRVIGVASFVTFNIGYLWFVKDAQYVARAAPTNELLSELARREPRPLRVIEFPFNPWIAKETTRLVPGWRPDHLVVNEGADSCAGCPTLVWDAQTRRYVVLRDHR